MPEIIEAEITKQKLTLALKGKRILQFETDWPKGLISQKKSVRRTARALKSSKINRIDRMGKAVVMHLEKDKILAIHQRMSGSVIYDPNRFDFKDKHIHFKFKMDDGSEFVLLDPRKFGKVWYGSKKWFLEQSYIEGLGPDAMKISNKRFSSLFGDSSASIKSFLLKQGNIAGLGNIACDEILWKAGIHPRRKAKDLNKEEIGNLYESMYTILASVLKHGGTSMSDWYHPDGKKGRYQRYFRVYNRDFCRRCRISIAKEKIAGRSTYFCTECQV
ncbi:MAG: DNA-formamidopyrimidine glycosylase [Candidatus Spechtbacterales bacterium]|nr:DNA-formamidopyrimidine glycosylase [Candidatus Spechtbacterales bacterium]